MNLTSRTIHSSSSAHLFYELNFELKFDSFGSWTKSNELIIESSPELFLSWFGSFPALTGSKMKIIYMISIKIIKAEILLSEKDKLHQMDKLILITQTLGMIRATKILGRKSTQLKDQLSRKMMIELAGMMPKMMMDLVINLLVIMGCHILPRPEEAFTKVCKLCNGKLRQKKRMSFINIYK